VDYYKVDGEPALTELGLGSYRDWESSVFETVQQFIESQK
jgi:hypothetical protein